MVFWPKWTIFFSGAIRQPNETFFCHPGPPNGLLRGDSSPPQMKGRFPPDSAHVSPLFLKAVSCVI